MSLPRALYTEIKSQNIGTLATTTMLLVASLFTIFSGSLFRAQSVPGTAKMMLRASTSFFVDFNTQATGDDLRNDDVAGAFSSLILQGNLSYPSFTFENLIFPELLLDIPSSANVTLKFSTLKLQTVVPAVRPRLDCRFYDFSKHRVNLTRNIPYFERLIDPLGVVLDGEECGIESDVNTTDPWYSQYDEKSRYNVYWEDTNANVTYIGMGGKSVCSFRCLWLCLTMYFCQAFMVPTCFFARGCSTCAVKLY